MAQSVIIMQKLKGKGAISQNLFMYVEEDMGAGEAVKAAWCCR